MAVTANKPELAEGQCFTSIVGISYEQEQNDSKTFPDISDKSFFTRFSSP